jgi:hypothetical protein
MVELHLHSPICLNGVVHRDNFAIIKFTRPLLNAGIVSSYTVRGMDTYCFAIQHCIKKAPISNLGPKVNYPPRIVVPLHSVVSSGNFWDKTVITPSFAFLPHPLKFINYRIS